MRPPVDDIDRIMAVMSAAFDPVYGEAWNRAQVEDALLMGRCYYALVGENGDMPGEGEPAAGFSLSRHGFEEEELLLFAIAPDARRRGLGSRLLQRFVTAARARGARRIFLEMRANNPAEHLYRRIGFTPIGQRPRYYRTPDGGWLDAITFALDCEN